MGYLVLFGTEFCQFIEDNPGICKRLGGLHWADAVTDRDVAALGQADLNMVDHKNRERSVVLACVEENWMEGLSWLIIRKPWSFGSRANPSGTDTTGRTGLHVAAEEGLHEMLKALLAAKVNVNVGQTVEDPEEDFDEDRDPRDAWLSGMKQKPSHTNTPLVYAATKFDVESCRLLLEHKADVNTKSFQQKTPLHLVEDAKPSEGQSAVACLLLSHNADPNLGNDDRGAEQSSLLSAVNKGNVKLVRILLEGRANVNALGGKSLGGMSSLHLAARKKSAAMAVALLEARADLTSLSSAGKIAAEVARSNNAPRIAEFLEGQLPESDREAFVAEAKAS